MIYKDFIAETSQKVVAALLAELYRERFPLQPDEVETTVKGSVLIAKALAYELEEDFKKEKADGGVRKYSENETFFDDYVNWTKTPNS